MDHMPEISSEQLRRLAQSEAGKQLFAMLQQSQGDQLKVAMDRAAAGDYSMAKHVASSMMDTPQAKELIRQLRSGQNG